jgi:hypothetical protein
MTTSTTIIAWANTSILLIDLGKYKLVSCVYDQAGGEVRYTTRRHEQTAGTSRTSPATTKGVHRAR